MKINREVVYNKCNGRCAYCEEPLKFENMEVDHIFPKHLKHFLKSAKMRELYKLSFTDINDPENLLPSCKPCNIHKRGIPTLEEWRNELQRQVLLLMKNPQFNRALRYGQIQLTPKPIEFHFEKLNEQKKCKSI